MAFVGKVDGEAFEGGTGEGMAVVIGSGNLIPGFEDQLVGVKAGEEKTIEVTFPEDYNAENLKGKAATFDLKITEVKVSAEGRSEEHTSELQSLMRISYAVFCLKKKNNKKNKREN